MHIGLRVNGKAPKMETALNSNLKTNRSKAEKKRAVRIVARSLYRELQAQGFNDKEVVSVATELLGEVTQTKAS